MTAQTYDVITIGRALHWFERSATLTVLERILVPQSWASGPEEKQYRIDPKQWFADSRFRALGETSVAERREVTIHDLIGRALSKSNTSPEILRERQPRFEAEIAAVLEPFVQDEVLVEQIVARASIFG